MSGQEPSRHLHFREPLGRGGFGTVYLADLRSGRGLVQLVAVKVLHGGDPDEGEVFARQRDEARLLAQLNHDHIVKVFDLVDVEGRPAVIMEYVEGVDAETWVKKGGPLPPRAALQVISGVASALDAAYNAESPLTGRPLAAIHRDIKPANVLVSVHGAVKVLDFGVAKADLERDAETRDAQVGTLAFISPEQWLLAQITPAVDIFALGLTLFRLLTGQVIERIPLQPDRYAARVSELAAVLDVQDWPLAWRAELQGLLRELLAWDPKARPKPRDVEERCLTLADAAPGDGLAQLARRQIPPLVEERRRKYFSSSVILPGDVTMTLSSVSHPTAVTSFVPPPPAPRHAPPTTTKSRTGLIIAVALAGLLLSVSAVGGMLYLFTADGGGPSIEDKATDNVVASAPAVVNEVRRRSPAPATATAAASTTKAAATTAATAKTTASATTTATTTRESRAVKGPTWPVSVSSVPLGAEVWVDGDRLGVTPLRDAPLTEGAHTIRVVAPDGTASEKSVRISERGPRKYIWNAESGLWESKI